MPTQATTRKAKAEMRRGHSASTAAGEFVREEMHHKRQRKHGAKSREQAIAIGLSKARRAGIPVKRRPKRAKRAGSRKTARTTTGARSR